jgi:hypothetical protein
LILTLLLYLIRPPIKDPCTACGGVKMMSLTLINTLIPHSALIARHYVGGVEIMWIQNVMRSILAMGRTVIEMVWIKGMIGRYDGDG